MFADGSFSYAPAAGFSGNDSFTYTIADGFGGEATATVTLRVPNEAPVAQADSYTVAHGEVLNIAAPGLLANDSDPDGDTLVVSAFDLTDTRGTVAVFADGSFLFTPEAGFAGTTGFTYTVADGFGGTATAPVSITVQGAGMLQVVGFTVTDTGFHLRFNSALNLTALNLYSPGASGSRAPDLVLVGPDRTRVPGTVVIDADSAGLEFITTGGPLGPGRHALALVSGPQGVVGSAGQLLDGNGDGVGGDDFRGIFNVAASAGSQAVLSVPELARGPGQTLANPANGFVFPITLRNAQGATQLSFTLAHDPALLNITGFTGGTLPAGSTVQAGAIGPGLWRVEISAAVPLPAGQIMLGELQATVPSSASYGAVHVLRLLDVSLDSGALPVRLDHGLHVVAFIGDIDGDAAYAAADLTALQGLLAKQGTGFGSWPLVNPLILGDINPNGVLQPLDAQRLADFLAGVPTPDIPPLPGGLRLMLGPLQPGDQSLGLPLAFTLPAPAVAAGGVQTLWLDLRFDAERLALTGVSGATVQGWTLQPLTGGVVRVAVALDLGAPGSGTAAQALAAEFGLARGTIARAGLELLAVRLADGTAVEAQVLVPERPVLGLDPAGPDDFEGLLGAATVGDLASAAGVALPARALGLPSAIGPAGGSADVAGTAVPVAGRRPLLQLDRGAASFDLGTPMGDSQRLAPMLARDEGARRTEANRWSLLMPNPGPR